MDMSFRDFLKYLKESGKSKDLSGGDFLRKASALWRGVEYRKAKRCDSDKDCDSLEKCGKRGGCVRDPKKRSRKRVSPKRSSPKRSSSKRASPKRSPVKRPKISVWKLRERVLEQLRGDPKLFPYMNSEGFVDIKHVDLHGLTAFQLGDEIEVVDGPDGNTYVRAIYGWVGPIAYRVLYGKYIPYTGKNNIFCLSHTSMFGLGELNFGRRINVLDTPDRCPNKGVRAFVNIAEARKKGITFFSKIGDKYGNRIFCFDPNLNENFYKIEYAPNYSEEENLKKSNKAVLDLYRKMMSEEKAVGMMKKLFLTQSP
jgi:hypothetical protein